jgi:hypothetical protein
MTLPLKTNPIFVQRGEQVLKKSDLGVWLSREMMHWLLLLLGEEERTRPKFLQIPTHKICSKATP